MTRLSVNLNKVALVRNSRDGRDPDTVLAAQVAIDAGAHGLTLHPRADARHATLDDVVAFGRLDAVRSGQVELNVECDPRDAPLRAALAAGAHQVTVVPVMPGERTSSRGWRAYDDAEALAKVVRLCANGPRVSLFVDADQDAVRRAAAAGVQAVEFYTGPYAAAYGAPDMERILDELAEAAALARTLGLRVHAGHDLTTRNLGALVRRVRPDEVSIGHALIGDALFHGLGPAVRLFLDAIEEAL